MKSTREKIGLSPQNLGEDFSSIYVAPGMGGHPTRWPLCGFGESRDWLGCSAEATGKHLDGRQPPKNGTWKKP